ncbi:GAF domain-containing hybrid sensor histidine kinase/response regulator [Candidatus Methylobacter oryzae]|uniref:histidine kinase n=1 Tax=Candidatus Methylobacter oryzae TaxID=2497749 RepID=A0ABY3CFK3_9GAMM|nr:ATP-binding protein [Candidatus Methylobacter oryzae]TRX02124.1 response regulator [Candidatus Methylobacter oryzae]
MDGHHYCIATDYEPIPSFWYAHAMEQLVEVVQQLSLARDLATVMDIVRHAARKLTGADGATFVLRDNDKCFYAEEDAISPLWKGQRFPMSSCISGWAMINRQPAVIEDIYADSRIPTDAYRPTFVRSLVMVPIRTCDPVGAIGNYWATKSLPSPEQVKVLQALADVTAVTMENVRMYEELEQRVQQRTWELQSILDNIQVGVIFAVGNQIVRANPKSAEIFDYSSPDAMLNIALPDLLRAKDTNLSLIDIARSKLIEGKVFNIETRICSQNKIAFWGHLIAKSLDATADPGSEIWVIEDISEAKAKEKTLNELKIAAENANQAKDSFLATMSHEIRTPLTGILGMMELLSLSQLDSTQRMTLDRAWGSSRSLLRIVNDILDWSKIEEGKLELAQQPTSIPQLLQDVVNTYSRVASAKNLMLSQRTDNRMSPAHIVDPLRLSQVLNNFVSNAIKFTQQGKIALYAELIEHHDGAERIRFSVKDTGIGIAKNVQEHLFERYRQESADTARMYGGTGLGLAICRRLAELMDGQITLASEPGLGTTFSIELTLPISNATGIVLESLHLEVEQRAVTPLFKNDAEAPKILAVDDHPINRDLLASQLKLLGLRAETAVNGEMGLSMWRKGPFALVITDCHMPEMDGYTLARTIRQIEAEEMRPRTTVIAWTANALAEETERCHAAGMDELLVKPANLSQLKQVLAKCLAVADTGTVPSSSLKPDTDHDPNIAPIDYSVLNQIVPNSGAQIQILLDFQTHIRSDYAALLQYLQQSDFSNAGSTAHRMKGSCRMVGAESLAQACAAIEHATCNMNLTGVWAAKTVLDEAIRQFEKYLVEIV